MFVVVSIGPRNHLREALGLALACGLFFGLIMAGYYRAYARILKLPKWSNYVPDQFAEDEDADW
jgi:hypothetical protein